MTWRLYRHDDAGAPVLDESKGSMINLLEKCLVTGYGTTEQPTDPPDIPWNVSKSADGLHAVFWSDDPNGSGHYFYIRDDGENDGDPADDQVKSHGREAYIKGAHVFTGFTNGKPDITDIFPKETDHPRGYVIVKKQNTNDNDPGWWVCADSRTVYMHHTGDNNQTGYTSPSAGTRTTLIQFGDAAGVNTTDVLSSISAAKSVNTNRQGHNGWHTNNGGDTILSNAGDGSVAGHPATFTGTVHDTSRPRVSPNEVSDLTGPLFSLPRLVGFSDGSAQIYRLRGFVELPFQLYEDTGNIDDLFNNLLGRAAGEPYFATFDFGGRTHFAMLAAAEQFDANVVFIDIEDDQ